MLTRQYDLMTNTLFLMSNGSRLGSLQDGLWSVPTESELQSPGLNIATVDDNARDCFFADLCIRYARGYNSNVYEPLLHSEIRQALFEESDSWKIIRCSAGYDTERRANVTFMLLNPELYKQEPATEKEWNVLVGAYSNLERGYAFVYLKPPEKYQLYPQHFWVSNIEHTTSKALAFSPCPYIKVTTQSVEVTTRDVDIIVTEEYDKFLRKTSTNVYGQRKDWPLVCQVHEDWIE